MKRRLITRISLLILFLIVQVGCGQNTATPTEFTPTEPPTEPAPTEVPATLIDPVIKPSLVITGFEGASSETTIALDHVIAFTTPEGEVLIKAAALITPIPEDDLTVVGAVEIGPEAEMITSGVYTLALGLANLQAETVLGRLTLQGGEGTQRDLTFERIPMERNPARPDDPLFPTIVPSITSDATCFTIGFADGIIAPDSKAVQSWLRFCSLVSSDTNELILSVRDNFPSQYEELSGELQASLPDLTEFLNANGFSLDEIRLDDDLVISEIEGHENIIACNDDQDCRSDLTGAPNALFWEQYDKAKSNAAGNNFAVTIALAKIERTLNIPDQVTMEEGVYFVRVWLAPEGDQDRFLGITFLGMTAAGELVPGQSTAAIEYYLREQGNPQEIESWISAWGLGKWCIKGQRRC